MTPTDYVIKAATTVIENGIETAVDRPMPHRSGRRSMEDYPTRMAYKASEHLPISDEPAPNAKKLKPTEPCVVCKPANLSRRLGSGEKRSHPESQYECPECNAGLHPQCFKAYHTKKYF